MAVELSKDSAPRKGMLLSSGVRAIMIRSVIQIVRRPLMWIGFFGIPLFMFLFITSMMQDGLPTRIPAALVDRDGTQLSRQITQTLGGMQMVDIVSTPQSYTEARHAMQRGEIYGFFMIPENFQSDLMAGRKPGISFYTNTTFFVPASLLFKTFKATAVYTKAGVAVEVVQSVGVDPETASPLLQPINIQSRGIGNPTLNYGIYLGNSFIPCTLQLMILLMTAFSLGQEVKYGTSRRLMKMAGGSPVKAIFGKLLPQTVIWWVIAIFMAAWLFKYEHYTMQGSWFWIILSELMFVVACQCMALFLFGLLPNLRLSLSASALLGILTFSLAAFSFPEQSMYPGIAPLSWITPVRYNFLIYSDIALNGLGVYYARIWFAAYIVFMFLPLFVIRRIGRELSNPIYVP